LEVPRSADSVDPDTDLAALPEADAFTDTLPPAAIIVWDTGLNKGQGCVTPTTAVMRAFSSASVTDPLLVLIKNA